MAGSDDDFPPLNRLTTNEEMDAAIAELAVGQGNVRLDVLTTHMDRYREEVLKQYYDAAELRDGPQTAWPSFRALLDMVEELEEDLTLSALRQACSNREHDQRTQRLEDDVNRLTRRLKRFAEQVERNVHANYAAGHLEDRQQRRDEVKKYPAIKKLKQSDGIKYDKSDTITIEEFCRSADKQFESADNNAEPKLTASDKILHVNSLIVGLADKDLETATSIATNTDSMPATWDFKNRSHDDYSNWLITVVFNDRLRPERKRAAYDDDVKKGYWSNPDNVMKSLMYKQQAIGLDTTNSVSNQQMGQDYVRKMLPPAYVRDIYNDDTYRLYVDRDKVGADRKPCVQKQEADALLAMQRASVIATALYRADQQTVLNGAPTSRAMRAHVNAIAENLPPDDVARLAYAGERQQQREDDVIVPTQTLAMAAERLERVTAILADRMGERLVGEERALPLHDDNDAELSAVADYNALVVSGHGRDVAASLAQREYNRAKRIELANTRTSTNADMSKVRCYGCCEFGHMVKDCHKPPSARNTPFRRLRRRPPMRGQRGMQPNRINVNLFRKESGTNRFTRVQEHEDLNSIDFCNECIYAAEDGVNEAYIDSFFVIV